MDEYQKYRHIQDQIDREQKLKQQQDTRKKPESGSTPQTPSIKRPS